mgnify:CR=1 FL=1
MTPSARPVLPLAAAAFAGGWALMMLEILGGRLMAPQFGYSVYQWGAIIGVVMTFMAAGYWAGGRTGDGPDAPRRLVQALLAGAVWAALCPWIGPPMLAHIAAGSPPDEGAIIAAAALLGVPSFALAMVSPLCAGILNAGQSGGTAASAGRVSAVSTLGSIGGTFFAAFAAIPYMGVSAGYGVVSAVLALGLAVLAGGRLFAGVAALLALAAGPAALKAGEGFALYRESAHNTIYVRDDGVEVRLHLNLLNATQTRIRRDGRPTGLYYDLFPVTPSLAAGIAPGAAPRVLILGLAGGAAATGIAARWPGASITGVELDPAVAEVAYSHFGLGQAAGVRAVVADARGFVTRDENHYDLVIIDLYSGASIPFYTATREFFTAVLRRLAPGGAVVMNIAAPADRDALAGPLAATLAAAAMDGLDGVGMDGGGPLGLFVADAGRGNHFLIATAGTTDLEAVRTRLPADSPLSRTLEAAAPAGQPVLTDDRSDIDLRTVAALFGGRRG